MDLIINLTDVTLFGLILSADSFSAALAMGFRPYTRQEALRFAASSGLAEGGATYIGALGGGKILSSMGLNAEWVASLILILVALHMAHEGLEELKSDSSFEAINFHSFSKVLMVSLVTSVDALGVGLGIGVSQKFILHYCLSIAFWAFAATLLGLYLARKISGLFGPIFIFFGAFTLACLAFQL